MNHLIKIFKASLVGMGSILPGISGSMVAAVLNIYKELITALDGFTKQPFKSIAKVWHYILGVVIGLGFGFVFLSSFLDKAPIPLTLLFIGFIIGAIPMLLKEVKVEKYQWQHMLVVIIAMCIMVGFLFIEEQSSSTGSAYYFTVFFIGVVIAISLIIPGLSGATVLMAVGYFQTLIDLGDDIIRALVSLDFSQISAQLPMLAALFSGVIIGLIVMGKIMFQLLKHYKVYFYLAVLGIVVVSPFNILFSLQKDTDYNVFQTNWYIWVISIILFLIGLFTTYMMSNNKKTLEKKND